MGRTVEHRASKQGVGVVLEIKGSMHLAPSLRSLRDKRDKLLQHFRRRHTSDSTTLSAAIAVPVVAAQSHAAPSRSSIIDIDLQRERRKSTPPEASRLGCIPSSRSVPSSSTGTRRDSCYTLQMPEETRQVEEAARTTTTTLATTAEPPSSIDTTVETTTPASPTKFEDDTDTHLPLAIEIETSIAPVASIPTTEFTPTSTPTSPRPTPPRRQSLFPPSDIPRITESFRRDGITLIEEPAEYEGDGIASPATQGHRKSIGMVNGKVWVRRREGSPTMVDLREEDMVDNLKDAILKKYQNALARHYDAPDLQLRIFPRGASSRGNEERILLPDELVQKTLDEYYPGGQTVGEALVIDVPLRERERKTPRPSPNQLYAYYGGHVHETFGITEGNEYFPPMPPSALSHPISHPSSNLNSSQTTLPQQPALTTGQVSSVPASPGPTSTRRLPNRPRVGGRTHTSAAAMANPVQLGSGTPVLLLPKGSRLSRVNSEPPGSAQSQPPAAPPLATPPIAEEVTPPPPIPTSPPPTRVASPRPKKFLKNEKPKSGPTGLMEGTVPPINVLIVEDNNINLKLLEAFMKRLKVRWQSAVNGQEAVNKWRAGGFHLVLMDIHLPVMNGLEATKEIRRLEKVNGIGVFSSAPGVDSEEAPEIKDPPEEDKLSSTFLFKSPVIIVALTASSLQSDRHEALAAGCNDFLTKV